MAGAERSAEHAIYCGIESECEGDFGGAPGGRILCGALYRQGRMGDADELYPDQDEPDFKLSRRGGGEGAGPEGCAAESCPGRAHKDAL